MNPTNDELLAMAYVDGELDAEARLAFETRMRGETVLGKLVAEQRALEVLGRKSAPPEPQDHEWARLRLSPMFRGSRALGWTLLVAGSLITLALTFWGVATNEGLSVPTRIVILGMLLGFLLLFATVVARRLRTYELDPYRHVER